MQRFSLKGCGCLTHCNCSLICPTCKEPLSKGMFCSNSIHFIAADIFQGSRPLDGIELEALNKCMADASKEPTLKNRL